MMTCKDCRIPMVGALSFTKDKHEKFYRCPRCYSETKHNPLTDSELDFEDVLHKEFQKHGSKNK